jgi:hypothetical protein
MFKTLFASLLFSLFLHADSFITPYEYSELLFQNPHGIGCDKCHGQYGKGGVIAQYEHKGEQRALIAPPLQELSFKAFKKALSKRQKNMPKYYLTQKEIKVLYYFVQSHRDDE